MTSTVLRTGLTVPQTDAFKSAIAQRESGGNYGSIGGSGDLYSGKYQIGPGVLQTQGYVRRGANVNINDERSWRDDDGRPLKDGIGSRKDFLNSPAVQEKVMDVNINRNYNQLKLDGIINDNTPAAEKGGLLGASHLLGPTGVKEKGLDGTDAFGTTGKEYYQIGYKAVSGGQSAPIPERTQVASAPPETVTAVNPETGETYQRLKTDPLGQRPPTAPGAQRPQAAVSPDKKLEAIDIPPQKLESNVADKKPIEINTGNGSTSKDQVKISLPIKNPLEKFTSFNSLFTFSALSPDEVNFPDKSYRNNNLGKIIISSAGRYADRVSTAYVTKENNTGAYEFFIDNVEMESIIAPTVNAKGTNVFSVNFEVTEPYSIGQFLQSCELAAVEKGNRIYGSSPYLLTIDFVGIDENGKQVTLTDCRRYIPLQITNVDMTVTQAGCKYTVNSVVWNEIALLNSANVLTQDVSIHGATPLDLLQNSEWSLANQINTRLKLRANPRNNEVSSAYIPDEVVIVFPNYASQETKLATEESSSSQQGIGSKINLEVVASKTNPNVKVFKQLESQVSKLGTASMSYDITRGGRPDKQDEIQLYENNVFKRNLVKIEEKKNEFIFRKGTTIVNAITEIMLMSSYCTGVIERKPDKNEMYDWFRIETEAYLLDDAQAVSSGTQRKPRILVFKVVPFKVHASKFSPNKAEYNYEALKAEAVKQYEYLYSGKNVDILEFQIKLNNAFYTPMAVDPFGKNSGDPALNRRNSIDASNPEAARKETQIAGQSEPVIGVAIEGLTGKTYKNSDGSPTNDYKSLVAKYFQERILNSDISKVTADVTIMGDPYYLADSGIGNYTNTNSTSKMNLTSTGSMDYQSGEVDILINFYTPVDLGSNGNMVFAKDIANKIDVPFSGLYQVWRVKHNFNQGKFTQVLGLLRRSNQTPAPKKVVLQTAIEYTHPPGW